MVKAVREAMVHTRWTVPNLDHEQALTSFVEAILESSPANGFLQDFARFAEKIAYHGSLNSLSQLVIKLGSPGVADFYQGSELWDLRLVDPDNRKAVDFSTRERLLNSLNGNNASLSETLQDWRSGVVKLLTTQRGLRLRQSHGALFLKGAYVPLRVEGRQKDCVIAFARRHRGDWAAVIVPRFTTRLTAHLDTGLDPDAWEDTRVCLPKDAPLTWMNVLTDEQSQATADGALLVKDVFRSFPAALLSNELL
jgi:(1->4)-alpha-D-glucan 1-alpha-D-glucosylmutase